MSLFERMTESKEVAMQYRAFCTSKKKEVWDALIFHANHAKNIERVYDMTTVLQRVQQEILVYALEHGVGTPEVYDAAELIFPLAMQKVVIKVLKPYFLSHWSIYRLNSFNPHRKLDHGIDVNEDLVTHERRLDYTQYIIDFNSFVRELKTGILNVNRHLTAAISLYIRELAAMLVVHQKAAFDDELRCSWLQEMMESLRMWADQVTMQDSFHNISMTIYKDVFTLLAKNVYQMVAVDFPEKFRGIITMKYCLLKTQNYGREELTKQLIAQAHKNLLIASVDTKLILKAYAACVESLREMDTSCVVMHKVCGVIKNYLKKRPDTVQQIISYITSNKKDELEKDMSLQSKTVRSAMMDEEELRGVNDEWLPENMETMGWEKWMPNPVDATVGDGAPGRQGVDVFNMLVSVYGSKELFVKEYRNLLAERLSGSDQKDPFFEKRYLDLLKLRFQYSELQHCEVMLRDVMHSQEIDEMVDQRRQDHLVPVSACIVSSHYWPKMEVDKPETRMPEVMEKAADRYKAMFLEAKRDRRVEWMRGVGCVEISLELDGIQVDRTIPNIYALVLFLFLEKEVWLTPEVMERLNLTQPLAKRRLEWLTKQGFLSMNPQVSSETWSLTRNAATILPNRPGSPSLEDEDDPEPEETSDMVDALEQYWGYTRNFIANHAPNGEVKAERMHRVYRMFGSPTSAGPTLDHVSAFLQRKVALGLLTCVNGNYRIIREEVAAPAPAP